MATLEDLKAKARQTTAFTGETETLALDADIVAEEVVGSLIQYFGENDERQGIRLTVSGEEIGYLLRADLYIFAQSTYKNIGSGDYATLPGSPNFRLISLRCPVTDCAYRLRVMLFDDNDPPTCQEHPGTAMEAAI